MPAPKTHEELFDACRQHLFGDAFQTRGVASVKVDDGEVFAFSTEKLQTLLKTAEANKGRVLLFVKTGPSVRDPSFNN